MGIKLFRNNFVAVNNTENNIKSKDVEIVDTDKIMIFQSIINIQCRKKYLFVLDLSKKLCINVQIVSVDGNYYMERCSINEAKLQKELDYYNEKNFDNKEYCITIDDVKKYLKENIDENDKISHFLSFNTNLY